MNRTVSLSPLLRRLLYSGAIAATATLSFLGSSLGSTAQATFHNSPKAILDEAWQIVYREYVDSSFNQVNWMTVRQELLSQDYSSMEHAYTALRQALEQLEDPYTRFLDPKQFQALTNQTSGELSGIGIRLKRDEATQTLVVVEPIANSPASQAGIQPGDRIVAIDGRITRGMTVEEASRLIQGEAGTPITLRVDRDGRGAVTLPLTRARIEVPNVSYSLRAESTHEIGYIRLTEFSSHAPEQMRQAIQTLLDQGADGFVLDLRGNPGGLLQASIDISRMWLEEGAIVRTVNRSGNSHEITANHTALTELPLAVLVDGHSASSSEILTGALMDNQRAIVVGNRTFGKALVQSVHSLSDGSGLAVTVAHYYTPRGTDISHRGIAPDIQVNLTNQQRQTLSADRSLIGTPDDPYYQEAVSALQPAIARQIVPPTNPFVQLAEQESPSRQN
ncbi:carboxyl-terminal processing protease CtpB [Thermocoleostomius sinensis]|uniref:S41 family peptidase n=1 Tax=Thermocoleostomius sinensis A174 TaxID=2016057 RepID=A0A9E9C852_9CYAN|nr:carboxyl-terminal processing protease CtpB [Thermocoleostomius sinensis]WAL61054.1 S41 family peptidase [Thermocoleostomius sinensis A174]